MTSLFSGPWPWYVTGPLIGLFVPALLLVENRMFGVSANLRHLCSALFSNRVEYFRYDWRHAGLWNLVFIAGAGLGGFLVAQLGGPQDAGISQAAKDTLGSLGIHDFTGLAPREIFHWSALGTVRGFVSVIVGGFLVGFGSSYAGGCT